MSRAAEIVARFSEGKSFERLHSAADLLAMAYDELQSMYWSAEERAREAQRKLDSTIQARALELVAGYEAEIKPAGIPGQWSFDLKPMRFETTMLCAHPSKWDPNVRDAVIKQAGQAFTHLVFKTLKDVPPR